MSRDEFLYVSYELNPATNQFQTNQLFDQTDRSRDGYLQKNELSNLLKEMHDGDAKVAPVATTVVPVTPVATQVCKSLAQRYFEQYAYGEWM